MKALERFLVSFCIISFGSQVAGVTGSAFLLLISFMGLSIYYYVFGFAVFNSIPFRGLFKRRSYNEVNVLRALGSVASGMALATILVGILFKLLEWEGGDSQIIAGLIVSAIVVLIAMVRFRKSNGKIYLAVFYRVPIFLVAGILVLFY